MLHWTFLFPQSGEHSTLSSTSSKTSMIRPGPTPDELKLSVDGENSQYRFLGVSIILSYGKNPDFDRIGGKNGRRQASGPGARAHGFPHCAPAWARVRRPVAAHPQAMEWTLPCPRRHDAPGPMLERPARRDRDANAVDRVLPANRGASTRIRRRDSTPGARACTKESRRGRIPCYRDPR